MLKRSFIKSIEVWTPTPDGEMLVHGDGFYGPLKDFEAISKSFAFGYDEGLPGKAWALKRPVVLKDLHDSTFMRQDKALAAGLSSAVAIPIFAGDIIKGVVTLFCGDDDDNIGAIEVWHQEPDSNQIEFVEGYFGSADLFEFESRHIKFMKGFGLPGLVWSSGMPHIMKNLGRNKRFVRSLSAQRAGMLHAMGFPCGVQSEDEHWVLTMLSGHGNPLARRFESWVANRDNSGVQFDIGVCEFRDDLENVYDGKVLSQADGTIGKVWATGVPAINSDLWSEGEPVQSCALSVGLSILVALPIMEGNQVKSVVCWYL